MKRLALLLVLSTTLLPAQNRKQKDREPKAQAEITLRVIEASSAPSALNDAADLVPAELKQLLKFTRYHLVDSAFIRGGEDEGLTLALAGNLTGRVSFDVRGGNPPLLEYDVEIRGPRTGGDSRNSGGDKKDAPKLLETEATGKNGETIVLGASRMKDSARAMIVILTGKIIPSNR